MSPKSFIQFHQEGRKILGVQVRCLQTHRQTHRQANLVPEVAPPEVGHLKTRLTTQKNFSIDPVKKNPRNVSRDFRNTSPIPEPNI